MLFEIPKKIKQQQEKEEQDSVKYLKHQLIMLKHKNKRNRI